MNLHEEAVVNVVRTLVSVSLACTGTMLWAGSDAHAADVFPAVGALDLLPLAPIPGDGATVADLQVLAVKADGTPMVGMRAKVTATSGTVGELVEVGSGLYTVQYTAPSVDETTSVTVSVRTHKTKEPVSVDGVVTVAAPPLDEIKAAATPSSLVLGRDASASLTVAGPPGKLRTATSAGKVDNITRMPGGQITARYLAPKLNFPQVGLLTMADAADPLGQVGHVILPLNGHVDFPVEAGEGANVMLEVSGTKFGPVKAGADGVAMVPVDVPPGVNDAVLVVVDGDDSTKETIDLQIPPTRRVQLFPLPKAMPADAGRQVPLRVLVATMHGEDDSEAAPVFEVSSGTVGEARHLDDGVYQATWTLPGDPGEATVSVSVPGRDVDANSMKVSLIEARPVSVALSVAPDSIGTEHEVTAVVSPNVGQWSVDAAGGKVSASGDNDGAGTWTATITPEGQRDLLITSQVQTEVSPNPVAGVVVVPAYPSAPMDGLSATSVYVAAVDAFGIPVAQAEVSLSVDGPGSLPDRVTTDDDGVSTVVYTSGKEAGLAKFTATSGGYTGVGAILLLPRGIEGPALPAAGTVEAVVLAQRWLDTSPGHRLTREGDAAIPVAAVAVVGAAAIRPEAEGPDQAAAATTGVAAAAASAWGAVSDPAAGSDDDDDDNDAAVAADDADDSDDADDGDDAGDSDDADDRDDADAVAHADDEDAVKSSTAESDHPWLRARVSGIGSTYRYTQDPSAEPGPLLPSTLVVGDPDGSAALPVGAELDARAWGDEVADLPYIGVHGQFRFASYGIAATEFASVARDVMYNLELDVLGRIPIRVDEDLYWIGGKAGVHFNDFILFTGCLEPDCEVNFEPLGVTGLGVGAEVGAEVMDLYLIAGYTSGFAQFTKLYSSAIDINLGYGFIEHAFADLGLSMLSRQVSLQGEDSGLQRGEISDSHLMFKLGVGYQM